MAFHFEFWFVLWDVQFFKFYLVRGFPITALSKLLFKTLHFFFEIGYLFLKAEDGLPFDF